MAPRQEQKTGNGDRVSSFEDNQKHHLVFLGDTTCWMAPARRAPFGIDWQALGHRSDTGAGASELRRSASACGILQVARQLWKQQGILRARAQAAS